MKTLNPFASMKVLTMWPEYTGLNWWLGAQSNNWRNALFMKGFIIVTLSCYPQGYPHFDGACSRPIGSLSKR